MITAQEAAKFFKHPSQCEQGDRIILALMRQVKYHTGTVSHNFNHAQDITETEFNAVAATLAGASDVERETLRYKLGFLSGMVMKTAAGWKKSTRRALYEEITEQIVLIGISSEYIGDAAAFIRAQYGPIVLAIATKYGHPIDEVNAEVIEEINKMCLACVTVQA